MADGRLRLCQSVPLSGRLILGADPCEDLAPAPIAGTLAGSTPATTGTLRTHYANRVSRALGTAARSVLRPGVALGSEVSAPVRHSTSRPASVTAAHGAASPLPADCRAGWRNQQPQPQSWVQALSSAAPSPQSLAGSWASLSFMRMELGARLRDAALLGGEASGSWREMVRVALPLAGLFQDAASQGVGCRSGWRRADPLPVAWASAWLDGIGRSGWGGPIQMPLVPPEPHPRSCIASGRLKLLERLPVFGALRLICASGARAVVPIRRVYLVRNTISLIRFADGAEIPTLALGVSLDADSWAWDWEARVHKSALPLVDPGVSGAPVQCVASLDGVEFRLYVESITRERTFGSTQLRISGRGGSAVLGDPYAPRLSRINAQARTAAQLCGDILTLNGIPMGWSVDWELDDWLIPSGGFVHQGTWIQALAEIATAAGAYLVPHKTEQRLAVRHRYPHAPWDWEEVTADLILPSAVVTRESLTLLDKPAYNRVFVSGQGSGVLGQITRAGSAGDLEAPMQVDALITHADVARQRGRAILSDTGRQADLTLSLPVLPETGVIDVGTFVEYQDGPITWRGLVRSVSVAPDWPRLRQTIGVRTHVE